MVFQDETFWLTQSGMAELFDCSTDNISLHLKNIYAEEELTPEATTEKISVVRQEGSRQVRRTLDHYNLDAIIAVGYRVNSKKATRFRQWATRTLKEYIPKGFVLNDEMLKNGRPFGRDYFDELLERIREIRASERRAYQKIADVFEQCSYDYDKNSETTRAFYAFVQNKLHFAVTGKTAAELIAERATPDSPTMGLTTWKGAPDGKILKSDTLVAKNYLNEKELSRLNRLVTMFIDYAELMAEDEQLMSMEDWLHETDRFLTNNRRKVLEGKGHISREAAVKKVSDIYAQFRKETGRRLHLRLRPGHGEVPERGWEPVIETFDIAGYTRISVDDELDQNNMSIENQKAIIEDFVKQKFPGSTLTFYEDRDRSGYTFEQREGYQAMRKGLMAHQYDILIVKDFSRFSRRNSRGLVELEDLRDAGVRIISIGDGIDFPNDDDWLKIQFQFLINEMPVTDTSKKVKNVIKRRQADGKWICAAPYGYIINKSRSSRSSPPRRTSSAPSSDSTTRRAGAIKRSPTTSPTRASPPPAWRSGTGRRPPERSTIERSSGTGPL